METQLVRLDKPYNIIFSPDGKFGLHIATLIVVNEVQSKLPLEAHTYPVVGGGYRIDGEVWMDSELKDCLVICREGESVGLYMLKKIMEFYKPEWIGAKLNVPGKFSWALLSYGSKVELPIDGSKHIKQDYEVRLEFSEENNGQSCMVYAAKESEFYFYDYFDNEPPLSPFLHTNSEAIKFLAELRDSYMRVFHYEGVRSITFTTKDEKYQWFVDKLNATKADAAGV